MDEPVRAWLLKHSAPHRDPSQHARLQFLYAGALAPKRLTNKRGYDAAVRAWRAVLTGLTRARLLSESSASEEGGDALVLAFDHDTPDRLKWKDVGTPASLGTVIAQLAADGALIKLDTFLAHADVDPASSSWSLARRALASVSSLVFGSAENDDARATKDDERTLIRRHAGKWVVLELVQRAAVAFMERAPSLHADPTSRLYTPASFHALVRGLDLLGADDGPNEQRSSSGETAKRGTTMSLLDAKVLLAYLTHHERVCVCDRDAVKFRSPFEPAGAAAAAAPRETITQTDRGILSLHLTLDALDAQLASLDSRALELHHRAQAAIAKQQRTVAKSHLASKRQVEQMRDKRADARANVHAVLVSIQGAVSDEETVKAYELGTSTLRTLLETPSLSLDHVEQTTDALADAMADYRDVNDAIQTGGTSAVQPVDEKELEDELAQLVLSQEKDERPPQPTPEAPSREEPESPETERPEAQTTEPQAREAIAA